MQNYQQKIRINGKQKQVKMIVRQWEMTTNNDYLWPGWTESSYFYRVKLVGNCYLQILGHSRGNRPLLDTTRSPIFVKICVNNEFGAKTTKIGKQNFFFTGGCGIMPPKVGPPSFNHLISNAHISTTIKDKIVK